MNMQSKLYTIQFSHHPMTDLQPVPRQQLQNLELANFAKLLKKTKLLEKSEISNKRGFELMEKRIKTKELRGFLPPGQPPFIN